MDLGNFTADELEIFLGEQLRGERLRKNLSMEDVAMLAGVSVNTLRSLETGRGGRVQSLVLVARALGRVSWLQTFGPAVKISPLQIAAGKPKRLRASQSVLKPRDGKSRQEQMLLVDGLKTDRSRPLLQVKIGIDAATGSTKEGCSYEDNGDSNSS